MTLLNIIEIFRGIFFLTLFVLGFDDYKETQDAVPILELSSQEFKAERTNQIALYDLDNDGTPDLFVRTPEKGFEVYLNKKGKLKKHFIIKDKNFSRVFSTFVDFNHDGNMDVIITNGTRSSEYQTKIFLNNGKAKFTEKIQDLGSAIIGRVGSGDLNKDGFTDIILTGFKQNPIIFLNNGIGELKKGMEIKSQGAFNKPIISDIDGDGDSDIFITKFFGGKNELWINKGNN